MRTGRALALGLALLAGLGAFAAWGSARAEETLVPVVNMTPLDGETATRIVNSGLDEGVRRALASRGLAVALQGESMRLETGGYLCFAMAGVTYAPSEERNARVPVQYSVSAFEYPSDCMNMVAALSVQALDRADIVTGWGRFELTAPGNGATPDGIAASSVIFMFGDRGVDPAALRPHAPAFMAKLVDPRSVGIFVVSYYFKNFCFSAVGATGTVFGSRTPRFPTHRYTALRLSPDGTDCRQAAAEDALDRLRASGTAFLEGIDHTLEFGQPAPDLAEINAAVGSSEAAQP